MQHLFALRLVVLCLPAAAAKVKRDATADPFTIPCPFLGQTLPLTQQIVGDAHDFPSRNRSDADPSREMDRSGPCHHELAHQFQRAEPAPAFGLANLERAEPDS